MKKSALARLGHALRHDAWLRIALEGVSILFAWVVVWLLLEAYVDAEGVLGKALHSAGGVVAALTLGVWSIRQALVANVVADEPEAELVPVRIRED